MFNSRLNVKKCYKTRCLKALRCKQITKNSICQEYFSCAYPALACGKNKLLKWQTKLFDNYQLNIELKAVNSNNLFHVKAYFMKNNNRNYGNLVIGSANLTKSGIGLAKLTKSELIRDDGNTELLFHVLDAKFYDEFNQKLDEITKKSAICLSEIDEFKYGDFKNLSEHEKIYFKFCILANGIFIENDIAFFIIVRYVFEDEKRGKKGHHNSSNE